MNINQTFGISLRPEAGTIKPRATAFMVCKKFRMLRSVILHLQYPLRIAFLGFCLCMAVSTAAQKNRDLTNAELNIQKLFIEANQEKLLGAYEEAASLYLEVLDLDPDNDAAQYELARVYEAMNQNDKALNHIELAIRTSPDIEWYHVMKGDILEGMEEFAAAVGVYEHLTRLKPNEEYYYEHLVGLLKRINQPDKALRALDQYEQIAGVIPKLIYEKVDILNTLNQPGKAVVEIEKLLRLYPNDISHLHQMALQCNLAGDSARARVFYVRILELDPEDAKANLALASDYKESGDDLTYLKSIATLMSNPAVALDPKILELIPFVEKFASNPEVTFGAELGQMLYQIVGQYPNEAKAHAIYADYLFSRGDLQTARQEYERTLVLDKSVFAVWEQLLYLKIAQQDMDGVLRTTEQALDVFPNQGSIYYLRGVALAAKLDFNSAAGSLQQALIMSGRNTRLQFQTYSLLGTVYLETGHRDKAYDAFNKALKLQPQDVVTLNRYAYSLALNSESLELANEMAQNALQNAPGNADVEHTLAWIAFQLGDLKAARGYIEQCMDHGGGDRYKALEHYGDILFSMGETDVAVEHWQLSLDRGNPSEVLKRKITERRIIH